MQAIWLVRSNHMFYPQSLHLVILCLSLNLVFSFLEIIHLLSHLYPLYFSIAYGCCFSFGLNLVYAFGIVQRNMEKAIEIACDLLILIFLNCCLILICFCFFVESHFLELIRALLLVYFIFEMSKIYLINSYFLISN